MSFNSKGQVIFCFHLGVLIFAPFFNKLQEKGLNFIYQWLVAVLLGYQNIEQSKQMNFSSLEVIIGNVYKTLGLQRNLLKKVSSRKNTERILQFNAELLNVNQQHDFYYDPHTKHYTGSLKILATWCSSIRLADKGINMDYIHSTSGHPIYFTTDDNFYDLRERFVPNIVEFKSLLYFKKEDILTWVIDRGIYSMDVFEDIIESPDAHIITWEKGYKKNKWDENLSHGSCSIVKYRNNKSDVKLVQYSYQERQWDKNPLIKQIIVRVFDKNKKVLIEVSILTDDNNRPAVQVIDLMLKRWVQENDFKYMIKHFGLNQLTSYAFSDYKELRDTIEDKIHTCSRYKSLTKEIKKVRAKFKTALLYKHKFEEKHKDNKEKLSVKEQDRKEKIWKNTKELNASLVDLEQERKNTTTHVSKIDELIERDYKKLDTNTKDFMDAIKVLARNMFYLSFQSFKEKYNNYRDDHLLYRQLTRSSGTLEINPTGVKIGLKPQMEYQPKIRKIITQVLDEINKKHPETLNGSKRKIELFLDN